MYFFLKLHCCPEAAASGSQAGRAMFLAPLKFFRILVHKFSVLKKNIFDKNKSFIGN